MLWYNPKIWNSSRHSPLLKMQTEQISPWACEPNVPHSEIGSKGLRPYGDVIMWHSLSAWPWPLLISSLPANASHLLITSPDKLITLPVLSFPLLSLPWRSLWSLFFAGSTCRTGSTRRSIYNRLSVATTWHQATSTSETRRPSWKTWREERHKKKNKEGK